MPVCSPMVYKKWLWGGVLLVGAAVLLDALLLEQYFFQIKRFTIGNVGQGQKRLRLLLLTDLHLKQVVRRHQKLATSINELEPDLILIAGDAVDGTVPSVEPLQDFLALLDKGTPKVAILGNHDHLTKGVSLQEFCKTYDAYNCHLLVNQTIALDIRGERVVITGLDDCIEGSGDLPKAIADIGRETHHFLLAHSPLQHEQAVKQINSINKGRPEEEQVQISYGFAGHNHGGQVRLPGYIPVLPKQGGSYVNGWYNDQKPYLYVSRGYGTSTIPVRFGARAEITLFEYVV